MLLEPASNFLSAGSRLWRGRVLSRPIDPGNHYQAGSEEDRHAFRGDERNMVVALGFSLGPGGDGYGMRYAYVLFLDPAVYFEAKNDPRPSVLVEVANPACGRTLQYPTVPDAPTDPGVGTDLEFPAAAAPWQGLWPWELVWFGPASGVDRGEVTLRVGDPPVLLTSEDELEFTW